jgi:hypothetical protein
MRLTFVSPSAALIGLAVALPVLSFTLAESRARATRTVLRLPAPTARGWSYLVAIAALSALLALGAAQPVLQRDRTHAVRSDAEAFFVFDTTRSMAAAESPGASSRFARAKELARQLRSALPDLPVGVATLTDRVLPHLFPTASGDAFHATLDDAIGVERPPSVRRGNAVGTNLAAFSTVPRTAFFTPESTRRVLVVFTDAETRSFDPGELQVAFRGSRIATVLIRVGHDDERVFGERGLPDPAYRAPGGVDQAMATFAAATGGRAFDENEFGRAVGSVRRAIGETGPRMEAKDVEPTPLTAWAFGAAFLPLAFLLWRRNLS